MFGKINEVGMLLIKILAIVGPLILKWLESANCDGAEQLSCAQKEQLILLCQKLIEEVN